MMVGSRASLIPLQAKAVEVGICPSDERASYNIYWLPKIRSTTIKLNKSVDSFSEEKVFEALEPILFTTPSRPLNRGSFYPIIAGLTLKETGKLYAATNPPAEIPFKPPKYQRYMGYIRGVGFRLSTEIENQSYPATSGLYRFVGSRWDDYQIMTEEQWLAYKKDLEEEYKKTQPAG